MNVASAPAAPATRGLMRQNEDSRVCSPWREKVTRKEELFAFLREVMTNNEIVETTDYWYECTVLGQCNTSK
jgi:hypothetical protein